MTDPTDRCLRLLGLLQERGTWAGDELAAELGVTVRTVRRDVDRLRDIGYAVDSERGHLGGYRLARGQALPPLVLADDEAVALSVALRTATAGALPGTGEAAMRALGKIEGTLPARLRARVDGLKTSIQVVDPWGAGVAVDDLVAAAEAIRSRQRLRFAYTGVASAEPSARWVDPYRILSSGRRWYLSAWDPERDGWRLFRLDRMTDVEVSAWTYRPRTDEPDPAERVRARMSDARWGYQVVLLVDRPYEEVEAAYGRWTEVARAGRRTRMLAGAETPGALAGWLAGFPWPFELADEPGPGSDEVRVALAARGARLLAVAGCDCRATTLSQR